MTGHSEVKEDSIYGAFLPKPLLPQNHRQVGKIVVDKVCTTDNTLLLQLIEMLRGCLDSIGVLIDANESALRRQSCCHAAAVPGSAKGTINIYSIGVCHEKLCYLRQHTHMMKFHLPAPLSLPNLRSVKCQAPSESQQSPLQTE